MVSVLVPRGGLRATRRGGARSGRGAVMNSAAIVRKARQQQIASTLDQLQRIYANADPETERELERVLAQSRDYMLAWIAANRVARGGGVVS